MKKVRYGIILILSISIWMLTKSCTSDYLKDTCLDNSELVTISLELEDFLNFVHPHTGENYLEMTLDPINDACVDAPLDVDYIVIANNLRNFGCYIAEHGKLIEPGGETRFVEIKGVKYKYTHWKWTVGSPPSGHSNVSFAVELHIPENLSDPSKYLRDCLKQLSFRLTYLKMTGT